MNLPELIDLLSRPEAYPHPVRGIEVKQTHISVVFLAGPFAYKIKKPVGLGFLDFRTLEQRRHFCLEEVRLNRRLAPDVYLGVVPVTAAGVGGEDRAGPAVEWAVKMVRLPDEATLSERLRRGELGEETVRELAQTVARFHQSAEGGGDVASFGRFDTVAETVLENFDQAASQVGVTVSPSVFDRVRKGTSELLSRQRDLIEGRAARGVPREAHGDLRSDHAYLLPDRPPPAHTVVVDCLEFSRRLRCIDPVAGMAFLAMDLEFHGRPDLARLFAAAYFRETGDEEWRGLLPLYKAYRAVVRAKVEG